MTMSSAPNGPPVLPRADQSYRSAHHDQGLELDADGFPRRPPHAPASSSPTVSTAFSPISTPATTADRKQEPDLELNEAPSEPPRAGFSFPALHLGSFSSLKMDDFSSMFPTEGEEQGGMRASTPAGNDVDHVPEQDAAERTGQDTPFISGGSSLGRVISPSAMATSPNGVPAAKSPSLYDVTRMARSGSPFRPVPAPPMNDSGGRVAHQLSSDRNGSGDLDQDSDVIASLPPRTDYLIDSPGFLSEEGSQAFLRQSRIARRRTIVQDPNTSNGQRRDGAGDEEGYGGQVRSRQGSSSGLMGVARGLVGRVRRWAG